MKNLQDTICILYKQDLEVIRTFFFIYFGAIPEEEILESVYFCTRRAIELYQNEFNFFNTWHFKNSPGHSFSEFDPALQWLYMSGFFVCFVNITSEKRYCITDEFIEKFLGEACVGY